MQPSQTWTRRFIRLVAGVGLAVALPVGGAALPALGAGHTPTPRATLRHTVVTRTTAAEPASLRSGSPVRLRIPALSLRTSIEPVGLRAGALDVPTNVWNVGWFQLGPRPGDVGNAVIDGHLDSVTG